MKRILSLGAGVQSTVLFLMSCRGELPKLDHAIFADTQYEPPEVYKHLAWLEELGIQHGIPITRVTAGDLKRDAIAFRKQCFTGGDGVPKRYASIPLFVLNPDGSQGIIRRQCTKEYKIQPIERFIRREILGLQPGQRAPREHIVDQWFGITWDEMQRMRTSTDAWKRNIYPFCSIPEPISAKFVRSNGTPKRWNRRDCIDWLRANYPERNIPRSACICCPFRSNEEWRRMRDTDPESWAEAVRFDNEIREAELEGKAVGVREALEGVPYIHRQMVPLGEVDLRDSDEKSGQLNMFGMLNECEGMCGV